MRIQQRARDDGRRGSALALSLIAVVTVVVLSASFSQFASAIANRQAQAVNRKRAFYLAEAGLAEAFAGLTCGRSGNVGSVEEPAVLGDGLFWVEVSEPEPGFVRMMSTGMVGTGRVELSLVARRGFDDVASLGAFSTGSVLLGPGSLVDAYDSTLGAYAGQSDKSGASLGSNGNVTVSGTLLKPTNVKGDVTPGPGKSLNQSGSVEITGSTALALEAAELPAIDVPEIALGAPVVHSSPYPLVIPPGSSGYQSLTVASGAQVIVQGPAQLMVGTLALQASAELSFDTTQGPVELYVTDAADANASSLLTTSSADPADVRILVPGQTAQPIKLRASGPFHGVIYAPEATVVLGGAFELFGAVVGKGLTLEGSAKLHFDRHLAVLAEDVKLPVIASWRIVELSNSASDLATDPFDVLGLDPNLLPAPAVAHMDQTLAIDYYDASNVYHQYVGLESQFDWSVVRVVISATRDGEDVYYPSPTVKVGTKKSPGVVPVIDGPMI